MIVLDEHLMAAGLISQFRWYTGAVRTLPELAGFAGAEDDLIPAILCRHRDCLFVTNNAQDFWQKLDGHPSFCLVGFSLPATRVGEIPRLLSLLLKVPPFPTRAGRRGKVVRISPHIEVRRTVEHCSGEAEYYTRRSDPTSFGRIALRA